MSAPNTPYGTPGPITPFGQAVDVGVSWENITFDAEGGKRKILLGLSGNALPRRTLAIMGSSGAGKTTFLNALSDRLASDGKNTFLNGEVYINNVKYHRKYRTMVGYVTQDDILNPMSTPLEALSFSLRVRRGTDYAETEKQVDALIDELGLSGARNTVVGVPGLVAGLSGGERKRLNIGIELITNPKVLYLDEPTSGLDSVTSANICRLLKNLASRGRTVVFTIHQPTAECITYFDDLMLMCKGQAVYHGPMDEAVQYFTDIGYPCPDTHTPTDFFMTLMQNEELVDTLVEEWTKFLDKRGRADYAYTAPRSLENHSFTEQYLTSYSAAASGSLKIEIIELQKRAFRDVRRNKMLIGATIIQNLVFGLIVALIFIHLHDGVTGIADRLGLLFMVVVNGGFSSVFQMINNFPPVKAVFIRDQQSGAYSPFIFFITRAIAELPLQILASLILTNIIYWPTFLVQQASNYFIFFAAVFFNAQVGYGIGLAISTSFDSFVMASGAAPMIILPLMLCTGLLVSTSRLHPYWWWLEEPSFLRASYILLLNNEFGSLGSISCDAATYGASFCAQQPKNGDEVLSVYGFTGTASDIWLQWVILTIMFFVGRIIAVASLYRVARRKN